MGKIPVSNSKTIKSNSNIFKLHKLLQLLVLVYPSVGYSVMHKGASISTSASSKATLTGAVCQSRELSADPAAY